jgi:membrane protein required for colicin V production
MNALDYVLFAVTGILGLRCFFRGIISEVLSAAALVGGVLAGVLFHAPLGAWLGERFGLGGFSPVAGFLVAFAAVFIIVKIVEGSLRSVLEQLELQALDRVLGFAFGLVEGLVLSALVILILSYQPVLELNALLSGSLLARILLPLIADYLPAAAALSAAAAEGA